ncbi:hypothetical protein [Acidicapsa acidisoli]|uniref:hypothetical protein n=1 Tax=Acidicapsa acidisoli TaxID=1615681 RepID=UPI0021DFC627|nr:hypothetical protein [Acidicapsa acidisoli]
MNCNRRLFAFILLVFSLATFLLLSWTQTTEGPDPASTAAVGAQYDTTHVDVSPSDVDAFVASFLGTFGGKSTKQVIARVTPTPSTTTSQLLQMKVAAVRTHRDFTERSTLIV